MSHSKCDMAECTAHNILGGLVVSMRATASLHVVNGSISVSAVRYFTMITYEANPVLSFTKCIQIMVLIYSY